MGRLSPTGLFLLHWTIFSFGLIIFTLLKNLNYADFEASPNLTVNQVTVIWILLLLGILAVLITLGIGYRKKTPKYYTRLGFVVFIIGLGIFIVLSMLLHDVLTSQTQRIGEDEILGMFIGTIFTISGSVGYIGVKFPNEEIMKHFKDAVKEELRKGREEERQWRLEEARIRREEQRRRKEVKVRSSGKSKSKTSSKQPAVEVNVHEAVMSPPGVGGITVVKCLKCHRDLKLTTDERPLAIKCPYCEEIGVIKE